MPTTKDALTKAQALIRSKRYKEARVILKRLDHPTARLWLARLDTLDPEFADPFATPKQPRKVRRWVVAAVMLLALGVAGWLVYRNATYQTDYAKAITRLEIELEEQCIRNLGDTANTCAESAAKLAEIHRIRVDTCFERHGHDVAAREQCMDELGIPGYE